MDPQIEALRSKTTLLMGSINDTREALARIRDYNDAPTIESLEEARRVVILEYTEVVNFVLQQFKISNIKFKSPQSELELKVMELVSNRLLYGPPIGRDGGGGSRNGVVPGGGGVSRNGVVGWKGSLVLGIVIFSIALLVSYLRGE